MSWELEFFQDAHGREPVKDWLDSLDEAKQQAALRGLSKILAEQGPAVTASEYGKALEQGLYEFRLRVDAQVVLQKHAPELLAKHPEPPRGEVLLRIYFHPHGRRLILLLGGYDKGRDPSVRQEQKQIRLARTRFKQWRSYQGESGSPFRHWWVGTIRRQRHRKPDQ